jgi:hypothetical protein
MPLHKRFERALVTALCAQHKLTLTWWAALHRTDYTARARTVPVPALALQGEATVHLPNK